MLNDAELARLVEKLRTVREDISLIIGMYNKLDAYRKNIYEAQELIDNTLYELTGDKYYIQNKPLGGSKNG
jgi:hypothetical protein